MSKKADSIMDETENPETPLPSPRAARFGEGVEGKGARRERGVSGPQVGAVGRLGQFLRDVRSELKRVSWPTAREVKNTTIITLIAVLFFASYLFVVDQALARLITGLAWLVNKLFGVV